MAERGCPQKIQNFHDCSRFLESRLLQQHQNLFTRKNGSITIKLINGSTVTFKDVGIDSEDVRLYAVVKFFPAISYALVSAAYWEGSQYYLIDIRSGAQTEIEGDAAVSPNGQRIAVWNRDLDADYAPNALVVYRISTSGLFVEFKATPEDWGPDSLRWVGNDSIAFSKTYRGEIGVESKHHKLRIVEGTKGLQGVRWQIKP